MRIVFVLSAVLIAAVPVIGGECDEGRNASVNYIHIEFECGTPEAMVYWFYPNGVLGEIFKARNGGEPELKGRPLAPFKPPERLMAYQGMGVCVGGDRQQMKDRVCAGTYKLPCPKGLYTLDVKGADGWMRVDRSLRRADAKGGCDHKIERPPSDSRYSDEERVTVTLYMEKATYQKVLDFKRFADLMRDGRYEWTTGDKREERGQGSGAISENARWLNHGNIPPLTFTVKDAR